jgi:phage terminase Nu1 subunit (DNA packaging protein)
MKRTFLSKLQTAAVFGCDRLTVYSWVLRGCPCLAPKRSGAPARMNFEKVLAWRLAHLRERGYAEDALTLTEKRARTRLQALS